METDQHGGPEHEIAQNHIFLFVGVVAVVSLFSGWCANVILAGGITIAAYQRWL